MKILDRNAKIHGLHKLLVIRYSEVPDSDRVYSKVFRVLDSDRVPDDVQTVYNSALCTRVCVCVGGGWWGGGLEAWWPSGEDICPRTLKVVRSSPTSSWCFFIMHQPPSIPSCKMGTQRSQPLSAKKSETLLKHE